MARLKDDPSLKPILEEIERGGPSAMVKYWNDPEVLQKISQAMSLNLPGDAATSTVLSRPQETEEEGDDDDESIVHNTASVGDAERLARSLTRWWFHGRLLPAWCPAAAVVVLPVRGITHLHSHSQDRWPPLPVGSTS